MTIKKQTTSPTSNVTATGQFYDIAGPDDHRPADASGRPLIVTNRPLIHDPMMVAGTSLVAVEATKNDDETPSPAPTPQLPVKKSKMTVMPLSSKTVKVSDVAVKNHTAKVETATATSTSADELAELIEQRTYFLPINSIEKQRSRQVALFGGLLIILLALAWLNISLDAGFVTIHGVHALTHFFGMI